MVSAVYQQWCIISFLDCFCTGITLPVFNNYIVTGLRGTHLLLGMLGVVTILSGNVIQLFISPITSFVGPKNFLILGHIVGVVNYIVIIFANTYPVFLLFRIPFIFFNQTPLMIELIMSKSGSRHMSPRSLENFKSLGLIFGPFCGGILYHENSIFPVVYLLNILTTLNLVMVCKLPEDRLSTKSSNSDRRSLTLWRTNLQRLCANWSVLCTLKIAVFMGVTCFFIKSTLILSVNMEASPSLVGFTLAVYKVVLLATQFACQLIDNAKFAAPSRFWKPIIGCIMLIFASMFVLCTTSEYGVYLSAFVVLAISQEIFQRLWMIAVKSDEKEQMEVFETLVTCLLFVLLGTFCDFYAHVAVQLMALSPLVVATALAVMQLSRSKVVINKKLQ